jgi:hypothetical protein
MNTTINNIIISNPSYKYLPKKRLYDVLRLKNKKISMKDVEAYLLGSKEEEVQQVFKKIKKPDFLTITAEPRSFQIDIMEMGKYARYNAGCKNLLLIVDVMSRKAFGYCLKSNINQDVMESYKKFVKNVKNINSMTGDNYFNSKSFMDFNKEKGIEVFTGIAKDEHISYGNRLGIIDRLTRTLKNMISRRMVADNDIKWSKWINEIINLYNELPHRGLNNNTPNDIWKNKKEQLEKHNEDVSYNNKIFNKSKIGEGDTVRIYKGKKTFAKEGQTFSSTTHKVEGRKGYKLIVEGFNRDLKPHELLKVVKTIKHLKNKSKIEKVEKKNTIKRKLKEAGIEKDKIVRKPRDWKPSKKYLESL